MKNLNREFLVSRWCINSRFMDLDNPFKILILLNWKNNWFWSSRWGSHGEHTNVYNYKLQRFI